MNNFGYSYGGYPAQGFYNPPMPDQLAQLRGAQYQPQQQMQNNPIQMQGTNNSYQSAPSQPAQTSNSGNGMIWVQGEEGAKAFLVGAGNTVILWDSENPVIYIKSADISGVPSMRILDWTERTASARTPLNSVQASSVNYVTRDEWEELAARVDAITANQKPKSGKTAKTVKESEDNG